jgi:hypothetical protein
MNLSQGNIRRLSIGLTMGAIVALGLVLYTPVFGDYPRALITDRIDESSTLRLRGNTRPEANRQNDRGPVPDSFQVEHMLLQLKRSPAMESEFVQYIDQLTDKKSPNFRHWLTPQQIGEKYGPSQQDLDTIKNWLESHGFTVGYIYPTRMVMDVSGTAGQLREAFHADIHYLEVKGRSHIANISDPQIPRALAPAVAGIVSLHDFRPHPMLKHADYSFAGCSVLPTGPGTCYALVPSDVETIYNLNPLFREGILGQGQTIVVVEDSDTYGTDVATYRTEFLSQYTSGSVTTTHPNSGGNCADPGANGADGEANLDAEVASAVAPKAAIQVAACAATVVTDGTLLAIENLVSAGSPPAIISMSYGQCEAVNGTTANAAFYNAFQSAAAAGVSVFVSSGDEGASSCAPDFSIGADYAIPGIGITGWGETPYNVSVGGTDFEDTYNAKTLGIPLSTYWGTPNLPTYGSAKSYIPEMPWSDSCANYNIYSYEGFTTPYGASGSTTGFCNNTIAKTSNHYISTGAGSGGPSNCATGYLGANYSTLITEDAGNCQGYPKPSWQSVPGNPADGVRDIPDVAMFAANGDWGHFLTVCWSDPAYTADGSAPCTGAPSGWSGFGGTSVATPIMASVQALVNQYWSQVTSTTVRVGLPNPTYYSIANAQFSSPTASYCYSINQPGRRGLATSCTFNDITQGDIAIDCEYDGSFEGNCYKPASTYGVLSTSGVSSYSSSTNPIILSGGTGYTSAPTCTIAAPSNSTPYLTPTGGTIYGGGSQATCTAAVTTGTKTATGTITIAAPPNIAGDTVWGNNGLAVTVGSQTYTFVNSTSLLTSPNTVLEYTSGTSATTQENDTAKNLYAAITGVSTNCTSAPCFGTGTTANPAVTATNSSATITLTAATAGYAGNFAVSVNAFGAYYIYVGGGYNGAGPNYVSGITVTAAGAGYAPDSMCTLTGGGGSGAVCVANNYSTAPASYQPAFGATPGWDFATGLGSVNAYNLVHNTAW